MDVDEDAQPSSSHPLPPLPRSLHAATDASVQRVRIRNDIVSGNIESALVHLEVYPTVKRSEVGFELRLAHFVGMILKAAEKRKEEAASGFGSGKGKGKEREGTLKRKAEDDEEEGAGGEGGASSATQSQRRRTGSAAEAPLSSSQADPAPSNFLPNLPPTPSFPDIDLLDRIIFYGRQLRFTLEDPATAPPVPSPSSSWGPTTSSSSQTKSQTLFSYCLGLLAFEDPLAAEEVELGEGGKRALRLWTRKGRWELAERIEEGLLCECLSFIWYRVEGGVR